MADQELGSGKNGRGDVWEWEERYAGKVLKSSRGVLLVWLPKELQHHCRVSYAEKTCFQLGWYLQKALHGEGVVTVGVQNGFFETSVRSALRRFAEKFPQWQFETLGKLCQGTAEIVSK